MQMYKVQFRTQKGSVVDTGTILVCAGNSSAAEDMVSVHMDIPARSTVFDTSRVKPSVYELSRREFTMKGAVSIDAPADGYVSQESGSVHEITASAKVFAYSESSAIRRFASAVIENSSATKSVLPRHINELSVDIEKSDERVRPSRVDEQSIYKERRFFAGGASRPR